MLGPPVNNPPELSNNPLVQNLESKTNENVDKVEIENPNNIDIINAPSYFTLEAKLKKLHKTQKNLKSAAKKCKVSNQNTSLNENIQELNDSIKSTTESILSFEKTIKVLLDDKKKLYLPTNSSKDDIYINAEDFENFEDSNIEPFTWVRPKKHEDADHIEIPQPENKDTLKSSESTESNSIETSSPKSVDIFKFPKSFFTFFRGAGNLPSRTSQAYDVDKFTELEGCISDTPPLKPEILHNEILDPGRKPCCDRPPPSVNSCIERERNKHFKDNLDLLPQLSLNEKMEKFLSKDRKIKYNIDDINDVSQTIDPFFTPSIEIKSIHETIFFFLAFFLQVSGLTTTFGFNIAINVLLTSILCFTYPSLAFSLCFYLGLFTSSAFSYLETVLEIWNIKLFKLNLTPSKFKSWKIRFKHKFPNMFPNTKPKIPKNLLAARINFITNKKPRGNFRKYLAKYILKSKPENAKINHLNSMANSNILNPRIPFSILSSVPLVSARLGKNSVGFILDTGCPTNIVPLHILEHFEKTTGYKCLTFENKKTFQAHNQGELDILNYGVVIPLDFIVENGETIRFSLPFLIERTSEKTGLIGLQSIQSIDFDLSKNEPKNFFYMSKIYSPVTPTAPIMVKKNNDSQYIVNTVRMEDGLYSFENRSQQTFHDESCTFTHDPRIPCHVKYNEFHKDCKINEPKYLKTEPNQILPNLVSVVSLKNNKICGPIDLSPDLGTLEFICSQDRHGGKGSMGGRPLPWTPKLPQSETNYADNAKINTKVLNLNLENEFNELNESNFDESKHKDDDETAEKNNEETQEYQDLELEKFIECIKYLNEEETEVTNIEKIVCKQQKTELEEIDSEKFSLVNKSEIAKIFFIDKYFNCLIHPKNMCNCKQFPKKHKHRKKFAEDMRPKLSIMKEENAELIIFIRIPGNLNIAYSPIAAFLNKILIKNNLTTLNLCSNSKLSEALLASFSSVYTSTDTPKKWKIFISNSEKIHKISTGGGEQTVYKQQVYANSQNSIPSHCLQEPEAIPILTVNSFEQDKKAFLKNSKESENNFLETLIDHFNEAVSKSPSDIGCIHKEKYKMSISLKNPNARLPLDLPYPTSVNNKIACNRIVQNWLESGIVVESNVRTHGSRLTVAKKSIGNGDFEKIKERLKNENITIDESDKSELHRLNPNIFTMYELNKLYRICLDARSLNENTLPEIVCSQNPEEVIADLMSVGSSADQCKEPILNVDKDFQTFKEFLENEDDNDKTLYFSSLDIRAAHNSLQLTEQTSEYLNTITPDWSTIKFLRSPFGLKNVNSTFNRVLADILKELILKKLIIIYADDLLLCCRGKNNHRKLLIKVMQLFKENGLKISLNKCSAFVKSYQFLGFKFEPSGISLTDERIKSINKIPQPKDLKSLQRFLGSFTYISKFIPNLQSHLLPLTKLLNKKTEFNWGPEQTHAFNSLKSKVTADLKLNYIDTTEPLYLYCDSSRWAGGSVLYQEEKITKRKKPIAFFSRKYSQNQARLCSSLELELINVIDSLSRIQAFINNSAKKLILVTDAKNILFLLKNNQTGPNLKLSRLGARLANFDINYEIKYESPLENEPFCIADFLSRAFHPENGSEKNTPMRELRKVMKDDITHDLKEGQIYSLTDLQNLTNQNEQWFKNFPTPDEKDYKNDSPDLQYETETFEHPALAPLKEGEVKPEIIRNIFGKNNLSIEKLIDEQNSDESIKQTILNLKENYEEATPDKEGFYLYKNILHKLKTSNLTPSPENSVLVLPSKLLANTIAHHHILYGHLGIDRMTKIISAQYYSKNLSKKIKDLIGSCHLCQIFKSHNTRSPPISPGEFPSHPMQTLSLDYFSVPPSHGFKYILLAIDRFSGYIFTKPCKNESADDVCEFLETIFSQAGPAITVTSDGGSTLTKNKKVKDLLSKWGVQKISTSLPYSPIHNSKAERAIRAFRHLMRVSSPDKLHGWFKICKRITYLMNSTPRVFKLKDKIEIFSPFELFLRRPPLPFSINTALIKDPTAKSQLLLEKEQIKKTDEFVIKYLKKQNEVYHENFNKNTKTPQFKVGDMVLLKHLTPPAQGQLPQKYKSPYKKQLYIVKFTSDNLTVLLDPITGNVSYQNSKHLKLYKERKDIYKDLDPEFQQLMGEYFKSNDLNSKSKLEDFLKNINFEKIENEEKSDISEKTETHSNISESVNIKKVENDIDIQDEFYESESSYHAVEKNVSIPMTVVRNKSIIEEKEKSKPQRILRSFSKFANKYLKKK